ncbi:MAG TPA: hypothetical protein DGG94_04220 [Micromonosporaceae bacterium]|nr:hypothetical protein [Micromonosporaceae bacterium]HCU49005.1 hypothetical protein [Micromonosporaceae bacterium]
MDLLDQLTSTQVPTWVMVVVVSVLTLSLLAGVPLARAAGRRRGHRLAHPEAFNNRLDKAKDTALFLAALVPSLLVWLAVMGVSFIGLTGFAKDVMGWDHWTNILVPLSLDGISVSFGAWAFVAVKRGRHPGRAYKIVLAAATMSAALNFVHGRDKWSLWAGLYLAFLSMAGMAMFHELLDQFMATIDDEVALKTRYPRFGQRWVYAPLSTFAARRAWIVHPPAENLRPSVRNALEHLQDVREAKRQRRLDGALKVREEQQAKLVEVHARAEVRRAKASGNGRRPEPMMQHRQLLVPPQQQPMQQHTSQPPPMRMPEPVLDPVQRAELESIFPVSSGREPMGRHPLWDEHKDTAQRYIAEALAMGETPMPGEVRDWAQREFGFRPSESWARDQIRAARSRDTVGMDADLV